MNRQRWAAIGLMTVAAATALGGCGLGYIEIEPESSVFFRIENAAPDTIEVTITVATSDASDATSGIGTAGAEGRHSPTARVRTLASDVVVRVDSGQVSSGSLLCGTEIGIAATVGRDASTVVQFAGAGTGTPGFDSGSVGPTGERFLLQDVDFACGDTVLIKLQGADQADLEIVPAGTSLPDPVIGDGDENGGDTPTSGLSMVTFRLENATPTAADVTVGVQADASEGSGEADNIRVRVPAGEFSTGEIACGETFVVAGTVADGVDSSVLFTGEGTGTPGFDSSSIGFAGERLLLFDEHYACGESIVVRITDDGSGIDQSTSETPLGVIQVFSSGDSLPEPELPDLDDPDQGDLVEAVTLRIVNQTVSTVQVNFATGNGTLATSGGTDVSSEFDVRVPALTSSEGVKSCAQEYIIAAAHLEATATTFSEGGDGTIFDGGSGVQFHAVVLTGDGTGTDGFDSSSIAVTRGRLFQLGTHFDCGDTITITVTATNNKLKLDDEGGVVTDEFGNPEIEYGVGSGSATVTSPEQPTSIPRTGVEFSG